MVAKNYDLLMLLAGEDLTRMPRTALALELYRSGSIGNILVSGSVGGLSGQAPSQNYGPHVKIANILNMNGVKPEKIFTDYRPVDTLGNFVFPYYQPLPNNPNPNELETIFLTEEGHMQRAIECAERVIPQEKLNHIFSNGEYQPDLVTRLLHQALMKATRDIKGNPEETYKFLMENHPFYREGWFDLSKLRRKIEVIRFIARPLDL